MYSKGHVGSTQIMYLMIEFCASFVTADASFFLQINKDVL